MAETVLLPQQGNTVESVILLQWSKQVGDPIEVGDVLCEVETDKTTMEVESTAAGTVLKHLFDAGDEIPVKTEIALVGDPEEPLGENFSKTGEKTTQKSDSSAAIPGEPKKPSATTVDTGGTTTPAADTDGTATPPADTGGTKPGQRRSEPPPVYASPRAKNLAAQNGVDLRTAVGTGPGGRVIVRDVEKLMETRDSTGSLPEPQKRFPDAEVTTIAVQGVRKVIAGRMLESLTSTAQYTLHAGADARILRSLRARFKEEGTSHGLERVTINDMVMFAVTRTLLDFPELNAHFHGTTISRFSRVDLTFAVDTDRGLMVPTVQAAHTLSLKDLAHTSRALAERCLRGEATPQDLATGTFTVTNLGSFGVERFTPVLNPPQVAILGVNTIELKPVANSHGDVEHIPHLGLSLTADHQAVDGAPAARFLQKLAAGIASMDLLLAQ